MRFPLPHCREGKGSSVAKLLLNGKALGYSLDPLTPVIFSSFMAKSWLVSFGVETSRFMLEYKAKRRVGKDSSPMDNHCNYIFAGF